jgi:predicted MPP superfamily phosphohydrolase
MEKFSRREFLRVTGCSLGVMVALTGGFLTLNNEANQAQVFSVTIPVNGLHASLEGFKILQMSDFHL